LRGHRGPLGPGGAVGGAAAVAGPAARGHGAAADRGADRRPPGSPGRAGEPGRARPGAALRGRPAGPADRRQRAAVGAGGQGHGPRHGRPRPGRGGGGGVAPVPAGLPERGRPGGAAGVRGEAPTGLEGTLSVQAPGPPRLANCSGFYGDRRSAPQELLEGGPIDVLTGDYLAELTMLILWRSRARDLSKGYATSFLGQMEECLGLAADKGVKVVANAGGLNPAGLAAELRELAGRLGLDVRVAHVEGDDLLDRLDDPRAVGVPLAHLDTGVPLAAAGVRPVTANAYLGAWGIVAALEAGADVGVCGRGPAAPP